MFDDTFDDMIEWANDDIEPGRFFKKKAKKIFAWKMKNGHIIPIKDMTNIHLLNTIKMLERNLMAINDTKKILKVMKKEYKIRKSEENV